MLSGNEVDTSHCAFNSAELVTISATLRDVCVGLAELAHPDTRTSNMTDIAYKSMWDHCFKVRNKRLFSLFRCN